MESKTERIVHATKVFCDQAQKKGLKICSWEHMPSFASFVEGQISEAELAENAREELTQFVQQFEKYTIVPVEASEAEIAEEEKKAAKMKKAKTANQIYKKACAESGKSLCFFKNFTSWQEFVEGRIGDEDLFVRAVEEIEALK